MTTTTHPNTDTDLRSSLERKLRTEQRALEILKDRIAEATVTYTTAWLAEDAIRAEAKIFIYGMALSAPIEDTRKALLTGIVDGLNRRRNRSTDALGDAVAEIVADAAREVLGYYRTEIDTDTLLDRII